MRLLSLAVPRRPAPQRQKCSGSAITCYAVNRSLKLDRALWEECHVDHSPADLTLSLSQSWPAWETRPCLKCYAREVVGMWPEEGLHRHMHILWQAPGSQVPRHNLQRLNGALHLQAATNAVRHTMHDVLARLNLHRFCCTSTVYEWACTSPVGAGAEHLEHANKLECTPLGRPAWHLRAHPAALSAAGAALLLHRQAPATHHLVQQCAEASLKGARHSQEPW